jgi:hypothetical protein
MFFISILIDIYQYEILWAQKRSADVFHQQVNKAPSPKGLY